ncbi:MAG: HAMP domain-containing protein, partial [Thermoanaerobaculia bacterium]
MSLGAQIFAVTAALVIFAIALAVVVTYFVGSQVGDTAARQALDRSGKVQLDFQESTFDLLGLMASLIAGDPDFSAYVQEAIDLGDVPSLLDQLDERRQGLDFDFAMLLDVDGMLVVRTDDPEARRQDFSREPLFLQAQEEYEAWGIWAREELLFYAMAVPVVAGDALVAYLVTAYAIDDAAAIQLRDINNTEVAFLLDTGERLALAAKTLGPGAAGELLAYLAARPELTDGYFEVELQRQRWLAWIRPLKDIGGDTIGTLIHLTSLEIELEGFRRIGRTLLGVGLLTMLLALVVSYLLPRRVLRPVRKLADAAIDAAEGNFDQVIKIDRSDEVGQLADAFDVLLSELREKRDMEIYVTELARTLPEPESSGAVEATQPEERLATLAGIELRNYSPTSGFAPMPPREILDQLSFDLRRLSRSIRAQDGKVEAFFGHRLIASFDGPRRSNRALAAAAEILSTTDSRSLEIAAVLVSGSTVSGTTNWDQRPHYTLTGRSIESLENLLRVARSGSLLISSEAREELRTTFDESGIDLQEHRSTVSELPLFSLSAESVARLAGILTGGATAGGATAGAATAGGATAGGAAEINSGLSDGFSPTHPMPSSVDGFPPMPPTEGPPTGF